MSSQSDSEPRLSLEHVSKDYPLPGAMRVRRTFSRFRGLRVEESVAGAAGLAGLELDEDEEGTDDEPVDDELHLGEARFGRRVVDDVTLELPGGGVVALAGPEGAGKTVLLKVIGGLVPPTEGRVVVRGTVVPALNAMSLIIPVRGDTVRSALPPLGAMVGMAPNAVRSRLDAVADLMEDPGLLNAPTGTMESRRRREVILALALCLEPDVLLLDMAIPDTAFGDRCLDQLGELVARGTLIVYETRDAGKLRLAPDQILTMLEGRVVGATAQPGSTAFSEPVSSDPTPQSPPSEREEIQLTRKPTSPEPEDPLPDGPQLGLASEAPEDDPVEAAPAPTPGPEPAPARAARYDAHGVVDGYEQLTPSKRMAAYDGLPLPEMELTNGLRVSVRSRKEYRRLDRPIDLTILEWLSAFRPGDVFYDIGANCGPLTLAAAAMHGDGVRIIAFEPGFANFEALGRNLSAHDMLGSVVPLQVALLGRTGLVPMRYHTTTAAGRSRHAVGRDVDYLDEAFTPVQTQTVCAYALDDVVATLGLPAPTHVKLGVDGTEEAVLRGAERTLTAGTVKALMIEVIDHDLTNSRLAAIQGLLTRHDYELATTFWHHPHASRRYVADHLFKRRRRPADESGPNPD